MVIVLVNLSFALQALQVMLKEVWHKLHNRQSVSQLVPRVIKRHL